MADYHKARPYDFVRTVKEAQLNIQKLQISAASSQAAIKAIQNQAAATYLPLAGGTLTGPVAYTGQASAPALQAGKAVTYANTSGNFKFVHGSDGNAYTAGRLVLIATATPQAINSTTPTTVTGCSWTAPAAAVGITYEFRASLQYTGNQAAGQAGFSILTGGASSAWLAGFFSSASIGGGGNQTNGLGTVLSPTLSTGTWGVILEGMLTLTAAGTVALQSSEGVSGDSFNILNAKFIISPAS